MRVSTLNKIKLTIVLIHRTRKIIGVIGGRTKVQYLKKVSVSGTSNDNINIGDIWLCVHSPCSKRMHLALCACTMTYAHAPRPMRMHHALCACTMHYVHAPCSMCIRHALCACVILCAHTPYFMRGRQAQCACAILHAQKVIIMLSTTKMSFDLLAMLTFGSLVSCSAPELPSFSSFCE